MERIEPNIFALNNCLTFEFHKVIHKQVINILEVFGKYATITLYLFVASLLDIIVMPILQGLSITYLTLCY